MIISIRIFSKHWTGKEYQLRQELRSIDVIGTESNKQ
jgi:hypothetical protein